MRPAAAPPEEPPDAEPAAEATEEGATDSGPMPAAYHVPRVAADTHYEYTVNDSSVKGA